MTRTRVRIAGLDTSGTDSVITVADGSYGRFQLDGGNSNGYLYGSFAALGDGVHLGYNYYANAAGTGVIENSDGPTSRLTVGYGFAAIATSSAVNTAPTERLRVDAVGNVGIGTASPAWRLDVVGGRSMHAASSEPYAVGAKFSSDGGAVYFGAASSSLTPDAVFSSAGGFELMRLTNTGRVGVGTTGPTGKLHAVNTDSNLTSTPLIRATGVGTNCDLSVRSSGVDFGPTTAGTSLSLFANGIAQLTLGAGTFNDRMLSMPTGGILSTPSYFVRAWLRFTGVLNLGMIPLVGSGNITSVTRNAAGDYTVGFNTPPTGGPGSDYCCVASCSPGGNSTQDAWIVRTDTFASSSVRISTIRLTASNPYGERADCESVSVVFVR